jgi:hypothetical protein
LQFKKKTVSHGVRSGTSDLGSTEAKGSRLDTEPSTSRGGIECEKSYATNIFDHTPEMISKGVLLP